MPRVHQVTINAAIFLAVLISSSASASIARAAVGVTDKRIDIASAVIGLEQRSGDLAMDASYEIVDGRRMLKVKLLADRFIVDAFIDVTSGITTRAVTLGLVDRDFSTPEEHRIASFRRRGMSLGNFLRQSGFNGHHIDSARFLEIGRGGRFSIVNDDEDLAHAALSSWQSQPADQANLTNLYSERQWCVSADWYCPAHSFALTRHQARTHG